MRWILALAVGLAVGCTDRDGATGLSDTAFVETMVELRRAGQLHRDTAAFAAEKQRILAERNVTESALRAYVERHVRDLPHMAAVWESVNVRLSAPSGGQ